MEIRRTGLAAVFIVAPQINAVSPATGLAAVRFIDDYSAVRGSAAGPTGTGPWSFPNFARPGLSALPPGTKAGPRLSFFEAGPGVSGADQVSSVTE
ncbi:hypothetical protein GCM10009828_088240 [Actinoplanes couchii]|uniref:Uncharacterized protein n=1 Tax=Actinoplanes couchii TaxID=403638 RepID=A0ABQ3XT80_9ACTN|nr:hypothetical protein Aco03nite_101250 [Actinoplanes couchii]